MNPARKGHPTVSKPVPPTAEALADLRSQFTGDDDAPERGPAPLDDPGPPETATPATFVALASPSDRQGQRAVLIAAWHADTTSVGFLHRGGTCGCRYLANVALDAVLPVQANDPDDAPDGD